MINFINVCILNLKKNNLIEQDNSVVVYVKKKKYLYISRKKHFEFYTSNIKNFNNLNESDTGYWLYRRLQVFNYNFHL